MPKKKITSKTEKKEDASTEFKSELSAEKEPFQQEIESLTYFGKIIQDTRISNNLSLESVSGHLHISVKILKAIEEGKPENGPTPVFFRGLVRTYCKFLELDKTQIIDKIDLLLRKDGSEDNTNVKTLKPVFSLDNSHTIRNFLTVFIIFFGGSILLYFYLSQDNLNTKFDNESETRKEIVEVDSNIETNNVLTQNLQEPSSTNLKNIKLEKESINALIETKKQKKSKNNTNSLIVSNSNEPMTLEIESSKETWISIAVDNNEIQDFKIKSEEIKQWVGGEKFLLTIGNTKVVRVLLNGREIETNRNYDLLHNWIIDTSLLP